MKRTKKGIEISPWKVESSDAFAAITPGWADEELDIGLNNDEYNDADRDNMDTHAQDLTRKKSILRRGNNILPQQ